MEPKIYFIVNPQAKNGYGMEIWKKIEDELLRKQLSYHKYFTKYRGHAIEIAKSIGKNCHGKSLVIAIGGDGTIHEVVNGVIEFPDIQVGFIPGGSGNDFCRGFAIPTDPIQALDFILENKERTFNKIDLGVSSIKQGQPRFFVNNMGAGFDAVVACGANRSKAKAIFNSISLGKLVYVAVLLKKLFTFQPENIEVEVDGSVFNFDNTWFITVSNQPFFGGGMKISPSASPYDGELNLTVVHNLSRIKLLAVFISVFWGGHVRFKEVKLLEGKNIIIHANHPQLVHLDGEIIGETPINVKAVPQALAVMTGDNIESSP